MKTIFNITGIICAFWWAGELAYYAAGHGSAPTRTDIALLAIFIASTGLLWLVELLGGRKGE